MKTTLNKIRTHFPCQEGWSKLLKHLGKTKADDEPLGIAEIAKSNGLDDALWCLRAVEGHDRELRLFAVWCARRVEHFSLDPSVKNCTDVAERFANGEATKEELQGARAAARAPARTPARPAARLAARLAACAAGAAAAAAGEAAWDAACAAGAAAGEAAWDAAWCAVGDAVGDAVEDAVGDAVEDAVAAAQAEQLKELLRVCAEIESKE